MVNANTLLLGLVGSLAAVSATDFSRGNVWWHNCGNCKCDDSGSIEGFTGATDCRQISTAVRALGLTANTGKFDPKRRITTCSVFTDDNCQNEVQSVGVASGETYGCTAFHQDARSIKCYFNA